MSIALQERLNALSAAVNALQLAHPAYVWIDPLPEGYSLRNEHYPRKKAKTTVNEQCNYYINKELYYSVIFSFCCHQKKHALNLIIIGKMNVFDSLAMSYVCAQFSN